MSIQSLMSAAHAAGFAMAVPEEFLAEEGASEHMVMPPDVASPRSVPSRALALATPTVQRAAWLKDWLFAWRAGAPA